MGIKAIGFDIDGTLYENYKMYLSSFKLAFTHPFLLFAFARARRRIRELDIIRGFHRTQAELLGKYMGISRKKAGALIDYYIYGNWEKIFLNIAPFPPLVELLDLLQNKQVPLGILSDFPVRKKLDFLGLPKYWDIKICSEDTGYLKPHPVPFLALSHELGIPCRNILYVGNNYDYDIVGAKRVGMMTAHFNSKQVPASIADFTFSCYKKLKTYVLDNLA